MKSSQINFYLRPEDISLIDSYIKSEGLSILSVPMKNKNCNTVSSLLSNPKGCEFLITLPELEKEIITKFIEKQNYYLVDIIKSPVIEFSSPSEIGNNMLKGRMYYIKEFFEDKQLVMKNEKFLKVANSLFSWTKKNIKNVKYSGYEKYIVTENTINWLNHNNGKLLLNNVF